MSEILGQCKQRTYYFISKPNWTFSKLNWTLSSTNWYEKCPSPIWFEKANKNLPTTLDSKKNYSHMPDFPPVLIASSPLEFEYLFVQTTMLSGLRDKFKLMVFNQESETKIAQSIATPDICTSVSPEIIMQENGQFKDIVYSVIRNIKDPEKPYTLEDLNVVYENGIKVTRNFDNSHYKVLVEFTPTVPHCSLASLIGLCIVVKLQRSIPPQTKYKLRVILKKGSHSTVDEITKQINDKERVAAAMEVGALRELVIKCISDED